MTMHSGKTDFNPTRSPLVQNVKHMEAIKELIRSDRRADFITMLNFSSREKGVAFCQCLDKCLEDGLTDDLDYVWNLGMSMVADKGHRAMMYSQTVAGLLVPQFYGGKEVNGSSGKKSDKSNE